jgi:hypothetical protein
MRYSNRQPKRPVQHGSRTARPRRARKTSHLQALSGHHSVRISEPAADPMIPPCPDYTPASGRFVGSSVRVLGLGPLQTFQGLDVIYHLQRPSLRVGAHLLQSSRLTKSCLREMSRSPVYYFHATNRHHLPDVPQSEAKVVPTENGLTNVCGGVPDPSGYSHMRMYPLAAHSRPTDLAPINSVGQPATS